jgi:NodT family efflux transporter outer membrane factor (OMF) lipoprotein
MTRLHTRQIFGVGVAALRTTFAAALVTVLVSGCIFVRRPPEPEEIRHQALEGVQLDHPWKAGQPAQGEVLDDWLASFRDNTLDALVREALVANPDLHVAAARMYQAGQLLVQARAPMFPAVGIAGTGGVKESGGGGDPSSALQGIVAAASWELDLWGRVRYGRNAASEEDVAAQADYRFARQSLAATVAKAWFTATQLALQARLTTQMVDSSASLAQFAADRERVGAGSSVETVQARAYVHNLEDARAQAEFARDQALRALELLLGRYPAAEIATAPGLAGMPPAPPAGGPLAMLERRPDVIAAERRVAAAFNRVGQAKAAMLPQITLNLNFGAFESEILQLKDDFENPSGGAGARLLAPIYMGGALRAQVNIRNLQQQEALATYAGTALKALNDVENALAAEHSLATRVRSLGAAFDEQQHALELTQSQLSVGRADKRSLEQQRLNAANAQIALLNVRSEELAQRVNLHLALGGSFEVPPEPPPK